MGLDIYLVKYKNFEVTKAKENEYSEITEKRWKDAGDYDSLTEEQKDEIRRLNNELSESMGLDKYGSDLDTERIEQDSNIDPTHLFKLGYLRSSYNESGINKILRNYGLLDLYGIFGREEEDEYEFQPNWEESLVRVNQVIEQLKKLNPYRVRKVSSNIFKKSTITSEEEALDLFKKELERHQGSNFNENYSNSSGEFYYYNPEKILAIIPGTYNLFSERECMYLVTEGDNDWYIKALMITKETIEYVLSQEEKEKFYFHWSS